MSLNKHMIIGNLGKDPEMRYTPGGAAVAQFSVATNRSYKDQKGEWVKETEWHNVVVWNQAAERAAADLKKGNKVYVEGRSQTRSWEDQSGQKKYKTEIVADKVVSLERRERDADPGPDEPAGFGGNGGGYGGGNGGGDDEAPRPAPRPAAQAPAPTASPNDFEDLPF